MYKAWGNEEENKIYVCVNRNFGTDWKMEA